MEYRGRADGPTFFEPTDLEIVGDLLFSCSGVRGLSIWEASGDRPRGIVSEIAPANVSDSRFPRCQHLAVDGSRVAITNRGDEIQPQPWLWIYDVANPNSPREVAGWTPAGVSIEGATMAGNRIFVAGHTSGLIALELSEAGLEERGRFSDPNSDAWLPVLIPASEPQALVVAEGATGLRTYDVAGAEPALLATLPLEGSSRDIVVLDGVAYVATSSGIASVDVRDPSAPVLLGTLPSGGTTLALAAAGPTELAVAEWDAVRGYDVSNPTSPQRIYAELVPTDDSFSRVLAVAGEPARGTVYAGEWRGVHAYERIAGALAPQIEISPQSIQLGRVALDEARSAAVIVRNDGSSTLTVHDVVSADGVSVDQDCFQLAPGEATALELRAELPDEDPFETELQFCSDDPDQPEASAPITANADGLGVGDPAPSFALPILGGSTLASGSLRGKVVVLAYFATF